MRIRWSLVGLKEVLDELNLEIRFLLLVSLLFQILANVNLVISKIVIANIVKMKNLGKLCVVVGLGLFKEVSSAALPGIRPVMMRDVSKIADVKQVFEAPM